MSAASVSKFACRSAGGSACSYSAASAANRANVPASRASAISGMTSISMTKEKGPPGRAFALRVRALLDMRHRDDVLRVQSALDVAVERGEVRAREQVQVV